VPTQEAGRRTSLSDPVRPFRRVGVAEDPRGNQDLVQAFGYVLTFLGAALLLAAIAYVLG
jgi:hypothetical protein